MNNNFLRGKMKNMRKLFCGFIFKISGKWNGAHSMGTIACVFFQKVTPG